MATDAPNLTLASAESGVPIAERGRRPVVEGVLILLFWTVMALLLVSQRAVGQRGLFPEVFQGPLVYQALLYYYFWAALTPLIFLLADRFGFDRPLRVRRILLHFLVGFTVAIVADVYGDYTRYLFGVTRRWRDRPFSAMESLRDFWWINEWVTYLAVLAVGFARSYFRRYQARREEAALLHAQATRLQAQLAEARLQSLRSQLNPHFLFNTLHAISSLVDRDPRGVRRMITRLSELLRYSLEGGAAQEIPLHEEMEHVDRYLAIEEVRFQGRLEIDKDIPANVLDALVPAFILQPLVENAIKHGLSRMEGTGTIEISAFREGDALFLTVRDNGPGLEDKPAPSPIGVGLRNTRERLEALYGKSFTFSIRDDEEGGVVVELSLPFHTEPVSGAGS